MGNSGVDENGLSGKKSNTGERCLGPSYRFKTRFRSKSRIPHNLSHLHHGELFLDNTNTHTLNYTHTFTLKFSANLHTDTFLCSLFILYLLLFYPFNTLSHTLVPLISLLLSLQYIQYAQISGGNKISYFVIKFSILGLFEHFYILTPFTCSLIISIFSTASSSPLLHPWGG